MRRVTGSVEVPAPAPFVLAFLATYFRALVEGADRGRACLSFPLPGFTGGLALSKPVTVEVRHAKSHASDHSLVIAWFTPGSSAFPRFSGSLSAEPHGDRRSMLTLAGTYFPPGGAAGAAFDALFGKTIAQATIEHLLHRLAEAAERDYDIRIAM